MTGRSVDRGRPPLPSSRIPKLREANHEAGGETIFGVVTLLHTVIGPLTKHDWRRQELLPATGGLVIVANHISNFDPMALGQFIAFSGRWPRFLGKASVFKVPLVGRILRACGQIPVVRESGRSRDALVAARAAIEAGRAVVVYPEGTITFDPDLWPMRGKTGAARLALETSCPVIPVGQWGAQDIMYGRRRHLPKLLPRKTLRMAVGEPVELDDLRAAPITAASLAEATDRIMVAISTLVAELRGEPAPAQRFDPRTLRPDGSPSAGPR
jgi:1-acyl-sn-glycerol-3-phosphate acyltransferase